jgi:hypothetical protein
MPSLYVNADWSALVPEGSPEAAFGITPKDARRRGLLPIDADDTREEPKQMVSANLFAIPQPAPEPEVKDAPRPADKEAPRPADKSRRKPSTK